MRISWNDKNKIKRFGYQLEIRAIDPRSGEILGADVGMSEYGFPIKDVGDRMTYDWRPINSIVKDLESAIGTIWSCRLDANGIKAFAGDIIVWIQDESKRVGALMPPNHDNLKWTIWPWTEYAGFEEQIDFESVTDFIIAANIWQPMTNIVLSIGEKNVHNWSKHVKKYKQKKKEEIKNEK